MRALLFAAAIPAASGLSAAELANEPSARQVRAWAAACAACHNTDGRSVGGFPVLAGRNADDAYRTLIEFKTGKRPATIMHQHTRGYTDEELRRLADWFAAIKPIR